MFVCQNLRVPRPRDSRFLALVSVVAAMVVGALAPSAFAATGPYGVRWQEPGDLRNHVVYRPLVPAGQAMPILVWGEGGCIANGLVYQQFLTEIASHGILVIASGGPYQLGTTTVRMMERSLDWASYQNSKTGGAYAGRLLANRVAVAGHSCGGLEAYQLAAKRSEIAAVGIMNSGQLSPNQTQLDQQKAPILYVLGGSGDVAYSNGVRDYGRLNPALPAFLASSNAGHFGTYFNQNGGGYAQILKDWVLWRINGNMVAGQTFIGPACGLCVKPGWTVQSRNM